MKLLVYVIGVPGAGKSTLIEELTKGYNANQVEDICPHVVYTSRHDRELPLIVEIGKIRESFRGTDALSMNIQPRAMQFLQECPHEIVIAEGDRLANVKFWEGAKALGWDVKVVLLHATPELAEERRKQRGSSQNETWLRGRETKVQNLTPHVDLTIVGPEPATALRGKIIEWRQPVHA